MRNEGRQFRARFARGGQIGWDGSGGDDRGIGSIGGRDERVRGAFGGQRLRQGVGDRAVTDGKGAGAEEKTTARAHATRPSPTAGFSWEEARPEPGRAPLR